MVYRLDLEKHLRCVEMLKQNIPYRTISASTGLSTRTIVKIAKYARSTGELKQNRIETYVCTVDQQTHNQSTELLSEIEKALIIDCMYWEKKHGSNYRKDTAIGIILKLSN